MEIFNLLWHDLTEEEKEQAKETYLCIREEEEQKNRSDITWEGVKSCKFMRLDNGYIEVLI